MEVAGAKEPKYIDGKSLLPILIQNKSTHRPLFWHYPHYHNDKPHGAVRYQNWKLIQYFEDMRYELYNLKDDITESENLVKQHPDKVKELAVIMNNWRKKVGAQMPSSNPNYNPSKANKKGTYSGLD